MVARFCRIVGTLGAFGPPAGGVASGEQKEGADGARKNRGFPHHGPNGAVMSSRCETAPMGSARAQSATPLPAPAGSLLFSVPTS